MIPLKESQLTIPKFEELTQHYLVDPVGEEGVAALELHGRRVDAVRDGGVLRAHEVVLPVLEGLQHEEVQVQVEAAVLPQVG